MAKKITVKMLKGKEMPKEEEFVEIFRSMMNTVSKMKKINEQDFSPLTVEEDGEFVAGIGFAVLGLIKKVSTPAAWKYIIEDMRKAMKE